MTLSFPKKSLKDIFNQVIQPTGISIPQTGFSLRTNSLPSGGESYQTPVTTPPNQAPIQQPTAPVAPQQPLFQQPTAPQTTAEAQIPQQWLKPDGGFYSPDEVAANIVKAAPQNPGGDIGRFSATQFLNPKMTSAQMESTATGLNNTRNDIASGETDPYGIASMSGIAYSPAELKAIENAYSGIFDPALNSALAKLNQKQQEEAQNNAPYTLGKDQTRYDAKGNIIASGSSTVDASSGVYIAGSNPTVDSYVKGIQNGTYKPSDVPEAYKGLVAQGMATTTPKQSQTSKDALDVVGQLLAKGGSLGNISGAPSLGAFLPGTPAAESRVLANRLSGILSLENRKQLKGQGAISDFEFKVLGDAASSLGIGSGGRSKLSDEDFVKQLENLQLKLQVGETSLPEDEIQFLSSQGYTPEQIRAIGEEDKLSFSSVGNTKVSKNLPQRNNNPGNVKGGGLADSLAIGKDSQGHLIFPDANTGFQALTMDVTAKVNGGSKYLPRNPTIAQLGSVYAEDPAWAKSVARIIGVPVTAQTLDIPIEALTKAIATQEGFYA